MLLSDAATGTPGAGAVMARASSENFPVASRLLPRRARSHLLAVYGFARLVDELGDAAPGDRLAALDRLSEDLERAYGGRAEHPLLQRLQPTLRQCELPREPFERLIEANRMDQLVSRYQTWEDLRGYCALSADPVGEIVLGIFGAATPARIELSDSICTALQLIEHCQDVAEDFAAGRVYLPLQDLARFGCTEADIAGGDSARGSSRSDSHRGDSQAASAEQPLREVIEFEVARARELLAAGAPLIDELAGRERLAVAAFLAGGRAAADAIERARFDVLGGPPTAGRARRALALMRVLRERRAIGGAVPTSAGSREDHR